jgi:hypothetical protein
MTTLKKSRKPPTFSDIIAIAGYVSLCAGLLLCLETFLALGRTQYPVGAPPSGFVPTRYFIYALESSHFFRYALFLVLFGVLMVFIGHVLGLRNRKHGRTGYNRINLTRISRSGFQVWG